MVGFHKIPSNLSSHTTPRSLYSQAIILYKMNFILRKRKILVAPINHPCYKGSSITEDIMHEPTYNPEAPYEAQAKRDFAYEQAEEKACDWLWDELRDHETARKMDYDIDAGIDSYAKLVSMIADLKKLVAIANQSPNADVQAYTKAGLCDGFLKQAVVEIERAMKWHVEGKANELMRDCQR